MTPFKYYATRTFQDNGPTLWAVVERDGRMGRLVATVYGPDAETTATLIARRMNDANATARTLEYTERLIADLRAKLQE
jgi:hypothetical protein